MNKIQEKLNTILKNDNRQSSNSPYENIYKLMVAEGYQKKQISFSRLPNIDRYLSLLSGNALILYIFYVSKANNNTGLSFWSLEKIADELSVSKKTVSNWNSNLIELGLIYRSKGETSKETYLLPTQSFIITSKTDMETKNGRILAETIFKKVDSITIKTTKEKSYIIYDFYRFRPKWGLNHHSEENRLDTYIINMKKTELNTNDKEKTIEFSQEYNLNSINQTEEETKKKLLDTEDLSTEKLNLLLNLIID